MRTPRLALWAVSLLCFAVTERLPAQDAGAAELPRGYGSVRLGATLDELTQALANDANYLFRDRDVYLSPLRNEHYVETAGRGFIKRAFFQLRDAPNGEDAAARVFVISLDLNPDRIDYYSVFTTLRSKYGEPAAVDPQRSVWESADVRVVIERPFTVKYIDRPVFDAILAESQAGEDAGAVLREDFLRDF